MRVHWRAAVLIGLAFLVAACGRKPRGEGGAADDPTVALVGGRPVTKSYYEDRLEKMERKFLPDTLDLAGRREFLQFIINKELMALKAEELGYGDAENVVSAMQLLENNLMSKAAIEAQAEGKTEVSEEEVQEFYERKQQEILVEHILLATRKAAEDVLFELHAGADFDSMVSARSLVPRVDQNGDPLPASQRVTFGLVSYGQAQPWVEKAIFETPLGEVTEPIQTAYGWHLFKPISKSEKRERPLTDQREVIERQIQLRKRRVIMEEYYESILAEHGFKLYEEALDLAYSKFPPDVDPSDAPSRQDEIKPVIDYTMDERKTVMFEVDGKEYTIEDFSDEYDETSWFERPKVYSGALGLRYWIRDRWLKPLQLERARKDDIHLLPEVANEVKFRREQMMVAMLHNNLIADQVPEPTDAQIEQFYEEHRDVYIDKEKRICNLIFHGRERVVRRAYQEILDGADFIETAIRYNDNATEAKNVQTAAFARDDEKHAEIAEVAFSLQEEKYSEPFKTSQGWVVLQVQHITEEKPFELEDIREFVIRDWKNQWSEDSLNELLEGWRQDYTIEVFDDVLESAEVRRDDVYVPGAVSPAASEPGAGETN
ncbi:MAG: peptidyl-prolyl cis-trans isomerase [Candidatus Krumholzibacteriia bacterium]